MTKWLWRNLLWLRNEFLLWFSLSTQSSLDFLMMNMPMIDDVGKLIVVNIITRIMSEVTPDSWPFKTDRRTLLCASFCKFHNSMHFIHKPPTESIKHLARRILSWPREGVHRFVYASRTSIFQLAAYAHQNTFGFLELSRAQWENQSTECQAVLDGASVSAPISMGEKLIGEAIFGSANMCWGGCACCRMTMAINPMSKLVYKIRQTVDGQNGKAIFSFSINFPRRDDKFKGWSKRRSPKKWFCFAFVVTEMGQSSKWAHYCNLNESHTRQFPPPPSIHMSRC